jgi:hypothetical protein
MTTRMLTALVLAALLGLSTRAAADDPKLPDVKAFDKLVIDTLRDVHNKGADLYNASKDFTGTYRMYQGALATVRPLLAHRPEAQKIIDAGLTAAEKESDAARKAFLLHEAIEGVRKNLKVAIGERKPDEPKKSDEKKTEDKKPLEPPKKSGDKKSAEPKKSDEKKPDAVAVAPMPKLVNANAKAKADPPAASVSGKITFAGKPLPEGEVTFVSLNQPLPRVFTATIKDGEFKFTEALPPGKYAGMVTGKGVPEKYHLVSTSGLRVELAAGANTTDLVLK